MLTPRKPPKLKIPEGTDIKAGSVVVAKGGGPRMTVSKVTKGQATCHWFEMVVGGTWGPLRQATFSLNTLKLDEA